MKKVLGIGLSTIALLAFVSCGGDKDNNNNNNPIVVDDNAITESSGYAEGAYAIFNDTDFSRTTVSYKVKGADDSSYTKVDDNLIRLKSENTARVDIVGLSAGDYTIKVDTADGKSSYADVAVSAYDRSGYAHFNREEGVGAYNNDGTLKNDAVVVYVDDATKNTVTATIGDTEYTGLSAILKAQANSNKPLDIRVIGTIKTTQWNYIDTKNVYGVGNSDARVNKQIELFDNAEGWASNKLYEEDIKKAGLNKMTNDESNGITKLEGLTNYMSRKQTNGVTTEYDSYFNDLDVKYANNITIEGIGESAGIFQFGFTFSGCNSVEVRNLTFDAYTEDAIGIQGGDGKLNAKTGLYNIDYEGYWIHNSTFNVGVNNWDVTKENDKADGDGSTDFKYAHNLTIDYVRYNGTHKTALIGPGDTAFQYNITLHLNYYNDCGSRMPLLRQSNVHMYNNYYYSGNNCQDIRANAFAYSEYNYFEDCNNAQIIKVTDTYQGTIIKSFNDVHNNSTKTQATVVTQRDASLTGLCKPDGTTTDYTNFDTNTLLFYYDAVNKKSNVTYMSSAEDAKQDCIAYAGAGTLFNRLK